MNIGDRANGYIYTEQGWVPESQYGPAYPVSPQTPALSWISLMLAIVGIFIIPIAFSTAAVITGHIALAKGRSQPNTYKTGVAVASLIVGYIGLAYGVVMFFITIQTL